MMRTIAFQCLKPHKFFKSSCAPLSSIAEKMINSSKHDAHHCLPSLQKSCIPQMMMRSSSSIPSNVMESSNHYAHHYPSKPQKSCIPQMIMRSSSSSASKIMNSSNHVARHHLPKPLNSCIPHVIMQISFPQIMMRTIVFQSLKSPASLE